MASCIAVNVTTGALTLDDTSTSCVYQVLTTAEINTINGLGGLFATYFDFDPAIAELLMGGTILAFVSGHVLGRIMGLWRKGF